MANSRQAEKMRSNISFTRNRLIFPLYSHVTGEVKFKNFFSQWFYHLVMSRALL